jgi:hypothetical protein
VPGTKPVQPAIPLEAGQSEKVLKKKGGSCLAILFGTKVEALLRAYAVNTLIVHYL